MVCAAALLGGLALTNLGCLGSAEALDQPSDEAGAVEEDTVTVQGELRRRGWRGWWTATQRPAGTTGTGSPAGTTGAAGTTGTGTTTPSTPTPSTPTPSTPTPSTGAADSSSSGGRCPNNQPMPEGGACGPYGITCTYDDTSSHQCICLNAASTGRQGWSCR